MSQRPFHRTLFLSFAGIISVAFLIFGALSLVLAFVVEDGVIDAMLKRQAAQLRHSSDPGAEPLPPGVFWVLEPGQAPAPVAEALAQQPGYHEVSTDGAEHYHVRGLGGGRGWLVAEVRPLLVVSRMSGFWLLVLAALWALALGFTLWLAYLAARHATQPLRQLLAAYRTDPLPGPALSTPAVHDRAAGNELHQLAQQLAELQQANRSALRREQAFTRDVSHELRTPLSVLQNQLLLAERQPLTPEGRARMHSALNDAVHLLDNLLALARQEPVPAQSQSLLGLLEQAIVDAANYAPRLAIDFHCAPEAGQWRVQASAHRVQVLCKNLIQNAALHGNGENLVIHLTQDQICFRNQISADSAGSTDAQAGPAQALDVASASGMRQGLSLSERLAEALGWQLQAAQRAAEGYFEVTIALKPE